MSVIESLLEGKKVSATVILAIISAIGGTIWSGALIWNQFEEYNGRIEENTAFIKSLKTDSIQLNNQITSLTTKIDEYDFSDLNRSVKRLEVQIQSLEKDINRTEKEVKSNGNPLSL